MTIGGYGSPAFAGTTGREPLAQYGTPVSRAELRPGHEVEPGHDPRFNSGTTHPEAPRCPMRRHTPAAAIAAWCGSNALPTLPWSPRATVRSAPKREHFT